jgi:hypothetical protein
MAYEKACGPRKLKELLSEEARTILRVTGSVRTVGGRPTDGDRARLRLYHEAFDRNARMAARDRRVRLLELEIGRR